jgi:hypothetical protein
MGFLVAIHANTSGDKRTLTNKFYCHKRYTLKKKTPWDKSGGKKLVSF